MLFKQLQVFQLDKPFNYASTSIEKKLNALSFHPCLPTLPFSAGWVGIIDEDDSPFVRHLSNCTVFCAQFEEKILPAAVVRKELANKIKHIEVTENRKVGQKEKWTLKDEIVMTLLPRAFSKFTRVYAYADAKNHWLVLGTANDRKTEQFLTLFKKTMGDNVIEPLKLQKLSSVLTHWVNDQNYPDDFNIEKSCVLQDVNLSNRVIRCQEQNLFSSTILGLIKEGCEVKQLKLSFQEKIQFQLRDDFSISTIQLKDDVLEQYKSMEPETKQQQFDVDFIIVEAIFSAMLKKLLSLFVKTTAPVRTMTLDAVTL